MTLSNLSITLGVAVAAVHLTGLINPRRYSEWMRGFPRSTVLGCLLMLGATTWFLLNLKAESISDFMVYKKVMYVLFGAIGVGACFFVKDFLAVRGLAVLFLLLAKLMVDTARLADTPWRWVISGSAYALVLAGIWFTISPFRLRDFILWVTATECRTRKISALKVTFGVGLILLGLTAYRG